MVTVEVEDMLEASWIAVMGEAELLVDLQMFEALLIVVDKVVVVE